MIANDKTFVDGRRKFYEEQYRIAEPMDPWHAYAQRVLHSKVLEWYYNACRRRGTRVLNAGSGGSSYGIAEPMTHLDLFESRVCHHPDYLVGDISAIPATDESYDVVICVGSVLNYADPVSAIRELTRVLRPGGKLILEYERSRSFEHRWEHRHSYACARVTTFYGGVKTHVWTYGDEFVDGLLLASKCRFYREFRFHGASTVALACSGSPAFATYFTFADRWLAQCWPVRNIASNRLVLVEKFA